MRTPYHVEVFALDTSLFKICKLLFVPFLRSLRPSRLAHSFVQKHEQDPPSRGFAKSPNSEAKFWRKGAVDGV